MRKGLEADFDAEKLMSGEWALSTDKGIIRICLEAGKVIRMATYEAFEEDMKQIEAILLECKSVEEAVQRINTEINAKVDAVVEYVGQAKAYSEQAKKYRDEAEVLRNEAEQFAPEGYAELKEQVNENTFKIDTVIEKADLGIKETASGEEIHLTDSAEGKAVEFALYGKARQNTTSGKNLLKNTNYSQTINGITFTVNNDGSVTANGTATSNADFAVYSSLKGVGQIGNIIGKNVIFSGSPAMGSKSTYCLAVQGFEKDGIGYYEVGDGLNVTVSDYSNFTTVQILCRVCSGQTANNLTFYPMIRLASITDDTYEPYTNGASPNPDYPQEIEVSGASGSVEVKSVGKNLLHYFNYEQNGKIVSNGITFDVKEDGGLHIYGTRENTSQNVSYRIDFTTDDISKSIIPSGYKNVDVRTFLTSNAINGLKIIGGYFDTNGKVKQFTSTQTEVINKYPSDAEYFRTYISVSVDTIDVTVYPMICLATEDDTYEPYKETLATISTPNGLAGIKFSSGGNYTDSDGQQWICDEIVKYADGSGEKIQRVGKAVFDGSDDEGWSIITANAGNQFPVTISNNGGRNFLCTHFRNSGVNNWGNVPNLTYMVHPTDFKNVRFRYDACTTVDEWRANLQANPMTVYYELAEPITTPLTAEEIAEISTFYPVTNISNDFDCGMKVKYNCDSKNYIDKQLAEMEKAREQAMMSMFLLLPEETQATMIENDVNNLLTESEI